MTNFSFFKKCTKDRLHCMTTTDGGGRNRWSNINRHRDKFLIFQEIHQGPSSLTTTAGGGQKRNGLASLTAWETAGRTRRVSRVIYPLSMQALNSLFPSIRICIFLDTPDRKTEAAENPVSTRTITQRERERQTDRQTDRQRDRDRHTDRQTE